MKLRLTGATFDASEKTVTHTSFSDITLEGIQLIVNVTDNIIIYNFASPALGGSLSTDTLTLVYDTTSMADADKLMIIVEDGTTSTPINDGGNTITVDGTVTANLAAGTNNIGDVDVLSSALPTGAATSAKQDTMIGHLDGVEGILTTIDGDTGNISTKIDTLAGAVAGTEFQVDVLTMPSTAVTNAGLTELAGAINASAQMDVNIAASGATVPVSHAALTELAAAINSDKVDVNIVSGSASGTQYTEGDTDASITGTAMLWEDGSDTLRAVSAAKPLPVDLQDTTVAVTQSGTWDEVGINDSGNSITVDNAQLSVVGTGTEAAAMRVTIATDSTGVLSVDDNGGALTVDGTVTANLAAGTNNIGDVDILTIAAGDNNIGNVDIVTAPAIAAGTNAIGKLLPPDIDVTTHTNYAKKYYTNAGAVTDGIVWSPAAGKRFHVVSMFINVSAAATVTFEDDKAGGDEAIMKMELAANSGVAYNFSEKYPLASGEDAADLIVTTSAGNVYITVTGYEI